MGTIITLSLLYLLLPLQAGIMARNSGRNFWYWFLITIPLPILSNYILLCLDDKSELKPVEVEKKQVRSNQMKRPVQYSRKLASVSSNA